MREEFENNGTTGSESEVPFQQEAVLPDEQQKLQQNPEQPMGYGAQNMEQPMGYGAQSDSQPDGYGMQTTQPVGGNPYQEIPPQYQGNGTNLYGNIYQNPQKQSEENTGFAVASMVLGILSILLFCTCIDVLTGVLAIIFGIVHLTTKKKRRGMAITGIVTGIIAILLTVFMVIGYSQKFAEGFAQEYQEEYNKYFQEQNIGGDNFF